MVRFAHLADSHLGYRQYGLSDREQDFYDTFQRVINDIISENVDFVIHSGDLFETNRPSNKAHFAFQNALKNLNDANIPVYAIAGNHDASLKKDTIPPQVLYRNQGLNLISHSIPNYTFEDVYIGGVEFSPVSYKSALYKELELHSKASEEYDTRILVLHQGIDKYMSFNYELEIGLIPENFHYYAMGHLHNYINEDYGLGKLVYPGSSEIWKTSEIGDYVKNSKGYVITTIENGKTTVERKAVDISREFVNCIIEHNNLLNELQNIKNKIKEFDVKPIVNVKIQGDKFNAQDAYDTVHKYLDDFTLQVRPTFELTSTQENLIDFEKVDTLDPKKFLREYGVNSGVKGADDFISDLYDDLRVNNMDNALDLSEKFYGEVFGKPLNLESKKEERKEKTSLLDWS